MVDADLMLHLLFFCLFNEHFNFLNIKINFHQEKYIISFQKKCL